MPPIIPENITVHLGRPSANAQNVTLPFPEYIKNVASSEIYPTWPESAIRANIYAQISFALNRIYTEFYRSQGYDFDITNSTANDQSFIYGRDIFENISLIVDDIFDSYVRRQGSIEPLFTAYCDGIEVQCNGLSQWGTVTLAERGLTPYQILTNYYGNNIDIVTNVPVGDIEESVPLSPLRLGSIGSDVQRIQVQLNRISANYPAIPKIYPVNGIFDESTEEAVREFQRIFSLTDDGIVGRGTWYRIQYIYTAVKRLASLDSEGLTLSESSTQYPEELSIGSVGIGVRVLQYFLRYIANFNPNVPTLTADGQFGPATEEAVRAFQTEYGLPVTGVVNEPTWDSIYNVYLSLVASIPLEYREGRIIPFPGTTLVRGSSGESVVLLQEYLNYIAQTYTDIPSVTVDGQFGPATENAVRAFQEVFALTGPEGVVGANLWDSITNVYEDLYYGNRAAEGQYPGYTVP
ncbi:MAG: peptidoglycan-binding protein [Clostridia bacterium]|nr:peptidoglycan-binding protein [Clostridia bacterium]